jgi:hypothetical protein
MVLLNAYSNWFFQVLDQNAPVSKGPTRWKPMMGIPVE